MYVACIYNYIYISYLVSVYYVCVHVHVCCIGSIDIQQTREDRNNDSSDEEEEQLPDGWEERMVHYVLTKDNFMYYCLLVHYNQSDYRKAVM